MCVCVVVVKAKKFSSTHGDIVDCVLSCLDGRPDSQAPMLTLVRIFYEVLVQWKFSGCFIIFFIN